MSLTPPTLARRLTTICGAVAALGASASGQAERWTDIGDQKYGMNSRIDLDSLEREGPNVTYTLEFTFSRTRAGLVRILSTAVIDCQQRQRKLKELVQFRADGSSSTMSVDRDWLKFPPGSLTEKVHRMVCSKRAGADSVVSPG